MVAAVTGAWVIVGVCVYIRDFIHCGGSGITHLRVGDVGHVPVDWEDAGSFSPSGDMAADRSDETPEWGQDKDVPYPGGGNGGGIHAGGGYIRHPLTECCHTNYCDKAHYGPVSGGGAAPRGTSFEAVMGTGGTQYGGNSVGCMGGGGG